MLYRCYTDTEQILNWLEPLLRMRVWGAKPPLYNTVLVTKRVQITPNMSNKNIQAKMNFT